jgi:ElaB/YqjD/DUF883 family membrane-anchored ribosome-binding protein
MDCALEGKKENDMAEGTQTPKKTTRKSPAKATSANGNSARKSASSATAAKPASTSGASEAKGRFNAALQEAKAGAAALRSEAADRAAAYRNQARAQSEGWVTEAKNYGEQAKGRAGELATDGKGKLAEAIAALGKAMFDTAPTVDDKLGAKYGDYARSASRTLQDASTKLDQKSVDELGEDAREFVRKSPGLAVGIAAVGGFLLARLFRGSND